MRGKAKKAIYIIGSLVIAAVVFLSGILFITAPTVDASQQTQTSGGNTDPGNGSSGQDGIGDTEGSGAGTDSGGIGGEGGDATGSGEGGGVGDGGSGSGSNGDGGGGGDGGFDGGSGGSAGSGNSGPKDYYFRICSEETEKVYLREENKGKYTGKGTHGFSGDYTYTLAENEIPASEYLAYCMERKGDDSHLIELEIEADLPRLYPYYQNKIYESDNGIKQYAADTYAYTYRPDLKSKYQSFSSINMQYRTWENNYYSFVREKYLEIDDTLKQTLLNLASENGIRSSSYSVITDVAQYIQNAAYYDKYFNEEKYEGEDMVTCFLTDYKRGVCRHFAAAATMMYRALGIPARYTVGFAVDVNADEWLIYGDDYWEEGHAWTEVYISDYGWVAVEVTGGLSASPEEEEEEDNVVYDFIVRTPSISKVYDGTPLKTTQLPQVISGNAHGLRMEIVDQAVLTDVGSISNKIVVKFFDAQGKDCTGRVKYVYGTLTVTKRTVTIKTRSKMATNVTSLRCPEYDVTGLVTGDTLYTEGLEFATQTGKGGCSNTITYKSLKIYSQDGWNRTKNYEIKVEYGTLFIY